MLKNITIPYAKTTT